MISFSLGDSIIKNPSSSEISDQTVLKIHTILVQLEMLLLANFKCLAIHITMKAKQVKLYNYSIIVGTNRKSISSWFYAIA